MAQGVEVQKRRYQRGHSLIEHVIQFALMIGIIIAIIYACGGDETGSSGRPQRPPQPQQQTGSQNYSPQQQRYAPYNAYTNPRAGAAYRDPRLRNALPQPAPAYRTPRRATQTQTASSPQETQLQGRQTPQQTASARQSQQQQRPGQAAQLSEQQAESMAENQRLSRSRYAGQSDLRVVKKKAEEDSEQMGRIIVIVAIIALAVIVFWFVHSNMMYKRTLRAVAASHAHEHDSPHAPPPPEASQHHESHASEPQHDDAHTHSHEDGAEHSVPLEHHSQTRSADETAVDKLTKLKGMCDKGLITPEDYEAKKKQILENL